MNEHTREAFTRQRRNLMAVSVVLLLAEIAGLRVTEVNLLGTKLILSNPTAVTSALWIGYLYWLWRYYVYFHDLGDKGFLSAYQGRMISMVNRIAFRHLQQDQSFIERAQGRKAALGGDASWSFHSPSRYVVNLNVVFAGPMEQMNAPSDIAHFKGIEVTARVPLLISHARAWLYVLTRTHLPSEYLLPYLIAAAPVVYTATDALTVG